MSTPDRPAYYTGREVAALLRVDPKTVTRWALAGKIPSVKTPSGAQRLYPADAVHDLLNGAASPDPLRAYADAIVDALMAAGIGVRDNESDGGPGGPSIGIDLDPIDSTRTPVMLWTPAHGWRIGVHQAGHGVDSATIRYLALGMVPRPVDVARAVQHWRTSPTSLTRAQPLYSTARDLYRRLTARAHG